jgi:hypothetical protein
MSDEKASIKLTPERLRQLVDELQGAVADPDQSSWGIATTGAESRLIQRGLFNDLAEAVPFAAGGDTDAALERVATAIDTLHSLQPRDAADGMLAAQMVATHKAAMEMMGLAMANRMKTHAVDVLLRNATRLMALHTKQQEMFERRRARADAARARTVPADAAAAPAAGAAGADEAAAPPSGEVVRAKFGT